MIDFDIINDPELENHIKILDEKIEHLKSKFDIELKTYSYILRIGLNIIQLNICKRPAREAKIRSPKRSTYTTQK
jgi:hypothetical protein